MKKSRVVDCYVAIRRVCIPYIPGLLAFREMYLLVPAVLRIINRYCVDLMLVDGHGISHPRRLGIASHVGLAFNKPSIGVAKKRLIGKEVIRNGNHFLEYKGEVVAAEVRTPRGGRIFVSPGHLMELHIAVSIVKRLFKYPYKLPYPLHLADSISKASKKLRTPSETLKVVKCPTSLDLSL